MAQHDMNIANQGFPATRADLNNALQALVSNSSGTSAPSTTFANQWWYDTTNNKLYIRNEANNAWIEVAVLDQTNNEWQISTGVVQAKDSDGLALKTDDGTTRLFIKDSDGHVGINDTSPAYPLEVNGTVRCVGTNNLPALVVDGNSTDEGDICALSSEHLTIGHHGLTGATGQFSERIRIQATTGFIGINETDPDRILHIKHSTPTIRLEDSDTSSYSEISAASGDGNLFIMADEGNNTAASGIRFHIDGSYVARFEDGDLLVGRTSAGITGNGHTLRGDDSALFSRNATGETMQIGRNSSDGDLIRLFANGAACGKIGHHGGGMFIGDSDVCLEMDGANDDIRPYNSTTMGYRDNAIDLGDSAYRFDDVYATNGTIQTSDEREKQQITSLTDAEMTAAKAISKLFKTFKWNDSVAENGDNARTHAGVIAQQVETAMSNAGLDAGNYAFFISTTWWESTVDHPELQAQEKVVDEDGNVTQEAQDYREAFTQTLYHATQEEAPEGATERNRKGIRYPELLSFIGAATEQRLTTIEARLDALEG